VTPVPLEGSLKEFALADIFQLISQQKKSGKLVLYNEQDKGSVLFHEGEIVSARVSGVRLQLLLVKYLVLVKGCSAEELLDILNYCKGKLRDFAHELMHKKYMSREELRSFAAMTLEDIVCTFFIWDDGWYRFDTMGGMRAQGIEGAGLHVEATVMEAMRRIDEWNRMRAYINDKTVFARKGGPRDLETEAVPGEFSDATIRAHLYSLIDGATSIKELKKKSFVPEYRIYEALSGMWEENIAKPLTYRLSHGMEKDAAPKKKESAAAFRIAASFIASAACITIAFLLGFLILHRAVLAHKTALSRRIRNEAVIIRAQRKAEIAALQYRTQTAVTDTALSVLETNGLLSSRDTRDLRLERKGAETGVPGPE
jgi:hypothetical protein